MSLPQTPYQRQPQTFCSARWRRKRDKLGHEEAKQAAIKLLAGRPHSQRELRTKLLEKGFGMELIKDALDRLEELVGGGGAGGRGGAAGWGLAVLVGGRGAGSCECGRVGGAGRGAHWWAGLLGQARAGVVRGCGLVAGGSAQAGKPTSCACRHLLLLHPPATWAPGTPVRAQGRPQLQ